MQHGVLHGEGDALALAGLTLLVECPQDADRHQHSGAGIAQRGTRFQRTSVRLAGDRHDAAGRLADHIEGQEIAIWSVLSETLHLRVDDRWIDLLNFVVAQAQSLDYAGGKIFDHHIGLGGQFFDNRQAFLRFEIRRNAFLIGVEDEEIISVGDAVFRRREATLVAALWVFDLCYIGAEPGQCLRTGWSRLELCEV